MGMSRKKKREEPRKGHGLMERTPDLLAATMRMDLPAIKACLETDPSTIQQLDGAGNNAMHLCIGGGTPRMRPIMEFFLGETDIDLLHQNSNGDAPIDLALAINDREAASLLYAPTVRQLDAANPDPAPELSPI
jgi:hypothetical protein